MAERPLLPYIDKAFRGRPPAIVRLALHTLIVVLAMSAAITMGRRDNWPAAWAALALAVYAEMNRANTRLPAPPSVEEKWSRMRDKRRRWTK